MKNAEKFLSLCIPKRRVWVTGVDVGDTELRTVDRVEPDQVVWFKTYDHGTMPPTPKGDACLPMRCSALRDAEFRYVDGETAQVVHNGKLCLTYRFAPY